MKKIIRVGELKQEDRSTVFVAAITAISLIFLYFFYPAFPTVVGKSLGGWAWHACNPANNFLHGRFIPLAFGVMCWMGVKAAKNEILKPSLMGLLALLVGLLFFLISVRTIQPRIAIIGAPFTILGIIYYLAGFRIASYFIFPAFFWWFTIPVPGLEAALTGNLQTLITRACYQAGIFLGMDLVSRGSNITVAGSAVNIAEGCSGIRSLMALTMIAAIYANYTQKVFWKKMVLFASALPLAIIGNFGRIFTILILANFGWGDFGTGAWHDWAGLLLFFPIALSGLYLFDYLLNFKNRRKKKVKRKVSTKQTMKGTEVS